MHKLAVILSSQSVPTGTMAGLNLRGKEWIFALVILALISPLSSAVPSGLTYVEATWAFENADDSKVIALNQNETVLAGSNNNFVTLFNASSLEVIKKFTFDRDITALEFSPDGSALAVSKGSNTQSKESLRIINVSDLTLLEVNALADDKAKDIAWNVNGTELAAPGENGDVVLLKRSDLKARITLGSVHNSDVNCIDFSSNGQFIVTGDESGRYQLWTSGGQKYGEYRTLGEEVIDCKFSPDGSIVYLLGSQGLLEVRDLDGALEIKATYPGGKQLLHSSNGEKVHLSIVKTNFRGLYTLQAQDLSLALTTTFFHMVEDVVIIEDDNGKLDRIFIATNTAQIAIYRRDILPNGFGHAGADFDGDLVPDFVDEDDDGDGLIDEWDNTLNCDAPENVQCSRYPDLNKIRRINLEFDDFLTIYDRITLPPEASSHIRNMSRISNSDDHKLSENEVELFSDAICSNMDKDEIIEQWRDSISLSSGAIGDGTVHCKIESGMKLIREDDYLTQIYLTIRTTFIFESAWEYPLIINLDEQPEPTDGSIAWLAPSHPMGVYVLSPDGIPTSMPLWWNNGEEIVDLTLEKVEMNDPTGAQIIIDWAVHPLALSLYLVVCLGLVLLWIRRDNLIEMDLNEEDEEDEEDEEESEEFEEHDTEEVIGTPIKRTPPKRIPITGSRIVEKTVSKTRRVSSTPSNKEGPIMKTKRRKLVMDEPVVVITKRKVVPMGTEEAVKEKKIKTRMVKKPEPIIVPQKKKKRRKPVRRKKTNSTKKIDENALQSDLMSGFLAEEE